MEEEDEGVSLEGSAGRAMGVDLWEGVAVGVVVVLVEELPVGVAVLLTDEVMMGVERTVGVMRWAPDECLTEGGPEVEEDVGGGCRATWETSCGWYGCCFSRAYGWRSRWAWWCRSSRVGVGVCVGELSDSEDPRVSLPLSDREAMAVYGRRSGLRGRGRGSAKGKFALNYDGDKGDIEDAEVREGNLLLMMMVIRVIVMIKVIIEIVVEMV